MKILQICKGHITNEEGVLTGGLEKVVVDIHELLLKNGYDSHVIDSTNSLYDAPNVHKIIDPDRSSKINNVAVANFAMEFDAVWVHTHPSIVSHLNQRAITFIYVDHWALASYNRMFYEALYTTEWEKAKENGSQYLTVSKLAQDYKEGQLQKWNEGFTFDGFIKFQYVTDELANIEVAPAEEYALVVSRPTSEKKMHLIAELGHPYKIVSMTTDYSASVSNDYDRYYASKIEPLEEHIHWNLDREKTMDYFRKSFAYYSTCPIECAGISGFEALCSGVPLIVNEKKFQHASRMFAPEGSDYICSKDDKDSIERFRTFDLAKRKEIATEVREYNSTQAFLDAFLSRSSESRNVPFLPLEELMHS